MSQEQSGDEDILLKLTMPGKNLRIDPKDAPKMHEEKPVASPTPVEPQPVPEPTLSHATPIVQAHQPQRETNTVVPPANTPPQTEAAQEGILRKLTMKPKQYEVFAPEMPKEEKNIRPSPGAIYQTPEEIRSNKPYVSSDPEIERVKKLAQNIYGTDLVQKRTQKK